MSLGIGCLLWLHVAHCGISSCPDRLDLRWTDLDNGAVHDYELDVSNIYMKMVSFYHLHSRPPFKEAFLLHKAPGPLVERLFHECAPLFLIAELLVAEADLLVGTVSLGDRERFKRIWDSWNSLNPSEVQAFSKLWPVGEAIGHYNRAITHYQARIANAWDMSTTFVICHCREPLEVLLGNLTHVPPLSHLLVYEKCNRTSTDMLNARFSSIFGGGIKVINQPDGPVRGDECTGYLDYIVENYDSLSSFSVFLQGDADHHLFLSFLDTALAAIKAGTYQVPFLHLNFHRHYQTTTPCMRDVEKALFNLSEVVEPLPLIGTYCCAQFIVHRDRIRARNRDFYSHALSMVNGSVPDLCSPTPPIRSSHCYILEYVWHMVFGEDRYLPHRPDDDRLPLLLRMKYGNENVKSRWDDVELTKSPLRLINRTVDLRIL
jgi:hypothetical protein